MGRGAAELPEQPVARAPRPKTLHGQEGHGLLKFPPQQPRRHGRGRRRKKRRVRQSGVGCPRWYRCRRGAIPFRRREGPPARCGRCLPRLHSPEHHLNRRVPRWNHSTCLRHRRRNSLFFVVVVVVVYYGSVLVTQGRESYVYATDISGRSSVHHPGAPQPRLRAWHAEASSRNCRRQSLSIAEDPDVKPATPQAAECRVR